MGFTRAHVLHTFDVFIHALYLLSHGCALLKYTCKLNYGFKNSLTCNEDEIPPEQLMFKKCQAGISVFALLAHVINFWIPPSFDLQTFIIANLVFNFSAQLDSRSKNNVFASNKVENGPKKAKHYQNIWQMWGAPRPPPHLPKKIR